MKLQDHAMLVSLSVGTYTGRVTDKRANSVLKQSLGTAEASTRVTKYLYAVERLKEIEKIRGEFRTWHYKHTLPYGRMKGLSVLPTAMYLDYMAKAQEITGKFYTAVDEFVANSDIFQAEAQQALNGASGLYDASEYLSKDQLRKKFSIGINYLPIPASDNLSITLDQTELDKIKADIEEQVSDFTKDSINELWDRIRTVVAALNERMTPDPDGEKVFKDSLIENLKEIADIIPKLNYAGDKDLNSAAIEIQQELASINPKELRKDKTLRADVKAKAEEILKRIEKKQFAAPVIPPAVPPVVPAPVVLPKAEPIPEKIAPARAVSTPKPVTEDPILAKMRDAGIL